MVVYSSSDLIHPDHLTSYFENTRQKSNAEKFEDVRLDSIVIASYTTQLFMPNSVLQMKEKN